jgi:hypothetical protein
MNNHDRDSPDLQPERKKLNPFQIVGSVLAAALGVQSSKNRERDFKQGNIGIFALVGAIFTLLFIGAVVAVVQIVITGAAK